MRKKEWKLIVYFHDTHEAIAFEKTCLERSISGRMIPLPSQISAGCGLAWRTGREERETMEKLLGETKVNGGIVELFM